MSSSRLDRSGRCIRPLFAAAVGALAASAALAGSGAPQEPLLAPPPPLQVDYALHAQGLGPTIRPLGDFYFFDTRRGTRGNWLGDFANGLRASTGVAGLGTTPSLFENQAELARNLPYVGLGYSHFWLRNQLALDADFGLASTGGLALPHLRGLGGTAASLDDAIRDLRWQPVMSVHMTYSF